MAKTPLDLILHWTNRIARHYVYVYKRQSKKRKLLFWLALIILMVFALPSGVDKLQEYREHSAEFYYLSITDHIAVGQSFRVEMHLRTGGQAINTMGAYLQFNPNYLEVTNMTTDKSFCTLYTDNNFDNVSGLIKLGCGKPNPGFQGDSVAVLLTMRAKFPGNTKITALQDHTMILANDGKGSNIIKAMPELALTVNQF